MEDSGDDHGAFMEKFILLPPPSSDQQQLPLHGLTFAIKDIFDVAGRVTGFGTPDWARTHAPAAATAPAVLAALGAGATGVGKTVMDEMAYSINGENAHYGTPANPCVPGGSSSGSAVAVAASLADFALGTNTGGSVRVPAAYCGIFGLRPSHGQVSAENVVPHGSDVRHRRDVPTLSRVTDVMLPPRYDDDRAVSSFLQTVSRSWALSTTTPTRSSTLQRPKYSAVMQWWTMETLGDSVSSNVPCIGEFMTDLSAIEASSSCVPALSAISRLMQVLQRSEFKANHAEWVNTVKPNLGPGIRERVQEAIASEDESAMEDLHAVRTEFKSALAVLLKDDGILAIPTVPGAPPKLRMDAALLEDFRAKAFSLLSIAGLLGFCQVSIPLGTRDGVSVSVSLLAGHGGDRFLVAVAQELYDALKAQAAAAWGLSA
ncbi:unnamed protein product [Triticum aestivum]|uniref:Amidase domain-containing protein n=3 Tax=Triticinae TaxID=1648030 RepID=A0A7H4LQV7_WHEAT|nr:unnamed protein product [Triticum aestivum]